MKFSTFFNLMLFRGIDVCLDFSQNGLSKKIDGIVEKKNVFYKESKNVQQAFDAYLHQDETIRPALFYVHGGGFVAGDKKHRRRMCREIASLGFNVFCVNHSLAPKCTYPGALFDLDDALLYITSRADEYRIDTERLVVGGDSSGGFWSALFTVALSNEEVKKAYGLKSEVKFKYAFFNCGLYDLNTALGQKTLFNISTGLFYDIFGKEYSEEVEVDKYVSSVDFVTKDFPKTFVIYAEKDYFCACQAEKLIEKLNSLGLEYDEFHSTDNKNNHCFCLSYRKKLSKECNAKLNAFLKEICSQ